MPASLGIMVTRCRYFSIGSLRVADTQILSIDAAGARQFGMDDPRQLVGRYMSDLQSKAWREMGHQRYLDRKLGRTVSRDYAVMIRTPTGDRGQRREFGGWLAGKHAGEDMYLTYLEDVAEIDHDPTIRVLSPAERKLARHYNGDCTVAELRNLVNHASTLDVLETFQHIIRECNELSSTVFAGQYHSGLDLALSDEVSYSLAPQTDTQTSLVRFRQRCERCGFVWFGRRTKHRQCPAKGCRLWSRGTPVTWS